MNRKKRIAADRMRMDMAVVMSAGALDAPLDEVAGDGRSQRSTLARQVAMYLASVGFGLSYNRVSQACGRDRSTVAHACRIVEERREDPAFDRWVCALESLAANMPVFP